jgi:TfoX/Sxy family transcriptional regulator of competence genes
VKIKAGVLVFVEVDIDATDAEDFYYIHEAGHLGMIAIRQALGGPRMTTPVTLTAKISDQQIPVKVVDAMELGMAVGNGYAWMRVTKKAYREGNLDESVEEDDTDQP